MEIIYKVKYFFPLGGKSVHKSTINGAGPSFRWRVHIWLLIEGWACKLLNIISPSLSTEGFGFLPERKMKKYEVVTEEEWWGLTWCLFRPWFLGCLFFSFFSPHRIP